MFWWEFVAIVLGFVVYPVALYADLRGTLWGRQLFENKYSGRQVTQARLFASIGAIPVFGTLLTLLVWPGVRVGTAIRG